MPTYEYECTSCGYRFEQFQTMTAAPLRKCPKCAGAVRRLIGKGAGIIFKGAGFHATDYGASSAAVSRPSCGRSTPCCGRDAPCNTGSCASR